MAKRLRWTVPEGIKFREGSKEMLIARFDNSPYWFRVGQVCSTAAFQFCIRLLGQKYGARKVEVKKFWADGADKTATTAEQANIINFRALWGGKFGFYRADGIGGRTEVAPEEIFA